MVNLLLCSFDHIFIYRRIHLFIYLFFPLTFFFEKNSIFQSLKDNVQILSSKLAEQADSFETSIEIWAILGKQSLNMIAYSIVCNLYDVVCLFSSTSIAFKFSLYENGIYLLI